MALLLGTAVSAQRLVVDFDHDVVGSPPDGFFFSAARQATSGRWEVFGSSARRHLVHQADPSVTLRGIAVAGFSFTAPEDIRVTTRLRTLDGDRAGGVVWRYTDANNFYFMAVFHGARSAALVRVTGGNRVMLHSVSDVDLDADAWHVMSVVHDGEDIRGSIDGIGILRARDRVLKGGDRAGVWSAGNTTTWFDDLVIESAPD